jgi:tetracycline 7-halogenase / FADH2 O2-dependent halogenase
MPRRRLSADVAILGSGFAGSLLATILERRGLSTVLLDRARHPRFAVGESSTPVADMILRRLGRRHDLPRLAPLAAYGTWRESYPRLGVGPKRGFSYFHHVPGEAFEPRADHANELLVAASSDPWICDTQWLRADVDAFLAAEAEGQGAALLEGAELEEIGETTSGWRLTGRQGEREVEVEAAFVVDGTGPGGVLPRWLGIEPAAVPLATCTRAIYGHFTGVPRWGDVIAAAGAAVADHPFPCDDAALHHLLDGGWLWMLRFDDGRLSAGLVLDAERHPLDPAVPAEAEWAARLGRYPSLAGLFAGARLADPPGRLIRTGRLQRLAGRAAGPTWALLPHTCGFVDPLHSTGIAHSLSGVERLAEILPAHWGRPTLAAALADYGEALHRELRWLDRLVALGYRSLPSFRLFAASTMLYFAATIHYERLRLTHEGGAEDEAAFDRLFLAADEEGLDAAAAAASEALPSAVELGGEETYERTIEAAIRPYNTAGLFRPAVANMYHHTAPR